MLAEGLKDGFPFGPRGMLAAMWVSVHFLTGAAAGRLLLEHTGLPKPLAPVAGAGLHAALDAAPHWDYTGHPARPLWTALDLAATAGLVLAGRRRLGTWVIAAGLASAAPDLDVAHEVLPVPKTRRLYPSHLRGFPHGRAEPLPGIAIQAFACAVALTVLLSRRR